MLLISFYTKFFTVRIERSEVWYFSIENKQARLINRINILTCGPCVYVRIRTGVQDVAVWDSDFEQWYRAKLVNLFNRRENIFPKKTFSLNFTVKFFLKEVKTDEEYSPSKFYNPDKKIEKQNKQPKNFWPNNKPFINLACSDWTAVPVSTSNPFFQYHVIDQKLIVVIFPFHYFSVILNKIRQQYLTNYFLGLGRWIWIRNLITIITMELTIWNSNKVIIEYTHQLGFLLFHCFVRVLILIYMAVIAKFTNKTAAEKMLTKVL